MGSAYICTTLPSLLAHRPLPYHHPSCAKPLSNILAATHVHMATNHDTAGQDVSSTAWAPSHTPFRSSSAAVAAGGVFPRHE